MCNCDCALQILFDLKISFEIWKLICWNEDVFFVNHKSYGKYVSLCSYINNIKSISLRKKIYILLTFQLLCTVYFVVWIGECELHRIKEREKSGPMRTEMDELFDIIWLLWNLSELGAFYFAQKISIWIKQFFFSWKHKKISCQLFYLFQQINHVWSVQPGKKIMFYCGKKEWKAM